MTVVATRTPAFAGAEAFERFVAIRGGHAAVDEGDGRLDVVGEHIAALDGGGVAGVFGIDGGADPEGALAAIDGAGDGGDDFVDARVGDGGGYDFLAVGGLFADDGDVEVAMDGERHRARDGRGAHHQHVGRVALGGELEAVGDAEAVLFVDDDEGEFGEVDVGLVERLRAGEDLDLSGADIVEDFSRGRPPCRVR